MQPKKKKGHSYFGNHSSLNYDNNNGDGNFKNDLVVWSLFSFLFS